MDCKKFREHQEQAVCGPPRPLDGLSDKEFDEEIRVLQELGEHQDNCAECARWLDHLLSSTDWGKKSEVEDGPQVERGEPVFSPLEDPATAHLALDFYLTLEKGLGGRNALRVVPGGSA